MVAAIEREFDWILVRRVPELQLACGAFSSDVQLIIVDSSLLQTADKCCAELSVAHPAAMLAVMTTAQMHGAEELVQVIETRLVRGILPSNVNLDIWLSTIRIMLKGGEYFPAALFQRLQRVQARDRTGTRDQRPSGEADDLGRADMDELTGRELEVLSMVARGCQNKIIAADLGLSEHTVKIHLHNIIRKLGVHNRTEAAARYLKHAKSREGGEDEEAVNGADRSEGRAGRSYPSAD